MRKNMMTTRISCAVFALLLCVIALAGCSDKTQSGNESKTETTVASPSQASTTASPESLWEGALYKEDKTLGNGKTQIKVEVTFIDKSVTFTVNTDSDNLGDALLENNLVSGDMGDYGLYIKSANGIIADYDADKAYWALYKNGEYLNSGADTTKIAQDEHYELVYSK